ncbi:retrotransposon protein, putative, ty1-copia subclass [Tanacetum coccineum]
MHVNKQPLPPVPEPVAEPDIVAQWTALYDAHTEIACLMLESMTPELHRQFNLYYPFDMIRRALIYEVGHWKRNCHVYLAELLKKKKQVGYASSSGFRIERKAEVGALYFNKRVKRNLDSTYLWHCRLAHINKKRIKQLQQDGLLKSTDDESFDKCESCLSCKMTKKPFPHSNERAKDLLGMIHTDDSQRNDGLLLYLPPENKIVVARYAEFFEKGLISQEISGRAVDLEEIQEDEDTIPSEITSNIP